MDLTGPDDADWFHEGRREARRQANRYSTGDKVSTPQGAGVVIDVVTEAGMLPEDEGEASTESPTYVVVVEDGRVGTGFYKASDIHKSEWSTDIENPAAELRENASRSNYSDTWFRRAIAKLRGNREGFFTWPESWRESPKPARLIAMDAWSSMGGDVSGCIREMRGDMTRPGRFCADFADRLYNYDYWRGDSWAPGD